MAVTPSFFKLVGISPAHGRAFTAEEGEIGSEHKVILSHALWQQLYGGDPSAIGRELRLGGTPFTIVGIMPRDFVFVNPEVRLLGSPGVHRRAENCNITTTAGTTSGGSSRGPR